MFFKILMSVLGIGWLFGAFASFVKGYGDAALLCVCFSAEFFYLSR